MNMARIATSARNARTRGNPPHFVSMAIPELVALSAAPADASTATSGSTAKSAANDAPTANARSDAQTAEEAAYAHTANARTSPARNATATGEQRPESTDTPASQSGHAALGKSPPRAGGWYRGVVADPGGGPGPGPAHEGMNSYSAQEGIDSKGNIIDL